MSPKIAVISTDWNQNPYRNKNNLYGGVGYYRIFAPYGVLKERGWDIDIYNKEFSDLSKGKTYEEFWDWFTKKYDIIITKAIDNPTAAAQLCFFAQRNGTKIVMDLDDNYFEVDPTQPAYKYYYPGSQKRAFFAAFLSQCDAVITSTKPLADYYQEHAKKVWNKDLPVYCFPNFNRVEEWPKFAKKPTDKIVIGWAGSTTHDDDLKLVMPALNRLMGEYPNVYLELTGGLTPETAPKVMAYFEEKQIDRVAITGGTNCWKGYPELLMKKKWNIGIAPLVNNEFNKGKSHIKWMEYAMMSLPCVASKTYPYYKEIDGIHTIVDGETGLLAIDGLDFYKKLKFLIDNPDVAQKIGENARQYVIDNWQWEKNIEKLENIIKQIWQPSQN
jgi:glycosyltransferase involved in cell wall biosynthesis